MRSISLLIAFVVSLGMLGGIFIYIIASLIQIIFVMAIISIVLRVIKRYKFT